ncbi:hypothetical protein GCM10008983_20760 [Lentibacillus halophilus]|uniref:Prepilin-type N-terminal cleavage/methylation domain-containing protein n=1 Tax=Lentibacillus halophilus TaxID=295065 RepID=A0ABP3J614_9BACI
MRKSNGFTLIETVVAASLLMMIITSLIPATDLLMKERMVQQQKRSIVNELHSELQTYLWNGNHPPLPNESTKRIKGTEAIFSFTKEAQLIKGCVTWTNAQKRGDTSCLYGYPDQ